jgi:hypothetical protein
MARQSARSFSTLTTRRSSSRFAATNPIVVTARPIATTIITGDHILAIARIDRAAFRRGGDDGGIGSRGGGAPVELGIAIVVVGVGGAIGT